MGFLDSLENNLKSLESRDERDPADIARERSRKDSEKARALAAAPFADALKTGSFTADLLTEVTRIGHQIRTKVHMTWIGSTLRLDAREKRMELLPTPDGVQAVFFEGGEQVSSESIDLGGEATPLVERWLLSTPEAPPNNSEGS